MASCARRRRHEGAVHGLDEAALLFQDEAAGLRELEVPTPLRILAQAPLVELVGGQAVECDQAPADVVGALPRQEVADQFAAAARDDAPPGRRILPELVALGRIDLVADDADDL